MFHTWRTSRLTRPPFPPHSRSLVNVFGKTPTKRFHSVLTHSQLVEMPHEHVYLVDLNLVLGYQRDDLRGWKPWVQQHVEERRSLFLLPRTIEECRLIDVALPSPFAPLIIPEDAQKTDLQ